MCIVSGVIPKQDSCIKVPSTVSMARRIPSSWKMDARQITVESGPKVRNHLNTGVPCILPVVYYPSKLIS